MLGEEGALQVGSDRTPSLSESCKDTARTGRPLRAMVRCARGKRSHARLGKAPLAL